MDLNTLTGTTLDRYNACKRKLQKAFPYLEDKDTQKILEHFEPHNKEVERFTDGFIEWAKTRTDVIRAFYKAIKEGYFKEAIRRASEEYRPEGQKGVDDLYRRVQPSSLSSPPDSPWNDAEKAEIEELLEGRNFYELSIWQRARLQEITQRHLRDTNATGYTKRLEIEAWRQSKQKDPKLWERILDR